MTYQEILDYAASHGFDIPADCRRLIRQLSALFLVDEGERLRLYGAKREGASTLALWCFSTISMSNSGRALAAFCTRSSITLMPSDMFAVLKIGITCEARSMASSSSAE